MDTISTFNEKKIPPHREKDFTKILATFLSQPEQQYLQPELFSSFIAFYEQTLRFHEFELGEGVDETHICLVVKSIVAEGPSISRLMLRSGLRRLSHFSRYSDDKLNKIINVALRLWLVIDINNNKFVKPYVTGWDDSTTLSGLITSQIVVSSNEEDIRERVDRMTMVRLEKYSGMKVKWTNDLREHLNLNLERRIVKIFNMKWYLFLLNENGIELFPKKLIQDYLLTMNLLFPCVDNATLGKYPELAMEGPTAEPEPIYLTDLTYWRDEILALWGEYKAPPPSVSQLFYDKRNALQWYTFWFAVAIFVLTIVFGVISSVLTGLQTGYSYESLKLAREAAVLAREAATAVPACPTQSCASGIP